MTITYTWKIKSLKTMNVSDTKPDAVVQAFWEKIGTDENDNKGVFVGATPFTVDPSDKDGPFIPYDQLTEDDVLAWVQSVVVGEYEQHVNQRIQEQIDQQTNAVVEPATLPWAAAPEAA